MSSGTNTAGTLKHDQNALRYQAQTIPQYQPGQDIGTYLQRLGEALQAREAAVAGAMREGQRAFQTLGGQSVEVTVQQDTTTDGTNWTRVYIPIRVFAAGATNQSNISGTNC